VPRLHGGARGTMMRACPAHRPPGFSTPSRARRRSVRGSGRDTRASCSITSPVSYRAMSARGTSAGNCQAAVELADRFDTVVASDPSRRQLRHAMRHGNICCVAARAEDRWTREGAYDLVAVGQALHWIDLDAFDDVVRQVAWPGAAIGVWGYDLPRVTPEIDAVTDRVADPEPTRRGVGCRRHGARADVAAIGSRGPDTRLKVARIGGSEYGGVLQDVSPASSRRRAPGLPGGPSTWCVRAGSRAGWRSVRSCVGHRTRSSTHV